MVSRGIVFIMVENEGTLADSKKYTMSVSALLGLTKGNNDVPAISYDPVSNQTIFLDNQGNPLKPEDDIVLVSGIDASGNFIPAKGNRPMKVDEYLAYKQQSFGAAQTHVMGYVQRVKTLVTTKVGELDEAKKEVAMYEDWCVSSEHKPIDLHFNKQKLKEAVEKRNTILESTVPVPDDAQITQMLSLAEKTDNVLDSINLKRHDLQAWDSLSQAIKEHYISLNKDYSSAEGRKQAIAGFTEQWKNVLSTSLDKLEEFEGKAPNIVLSDEDMQDRAIGFWFEFSGKALTSAYSFLLGAKLGDKISKLTKGALSDGLAIAPLVKPPLSTGIGIGGAGFIADAFAGIVVEELASKLYDAASLTPKMNMMIESGALTAETAKLVQKKIISESQGSFGSVVYGIDGIGLEVPFLGPIKVGDMSKVAAVYYGDLMMSGEYIPSKGTNLGQLIGGVEGNEEEMASRQQALGMVNETLNSRFQNLLAERENSVNEQDTVNPTNILTANAKTEISNNIGE